MRAADDGANLRKVGEQLTLEGQPRAGGAARYHPAACTLRDGLVIDGPFAETRNSFGLYVVNCRNVTTKSPPRAI